MLDQNTIQTINQDPKSIDLHELALSKIKNAKVNLEAKHDMIKDRMRTKAVRNYDEAYAKYQELKANGFLDLFNKKDVKEATEIITGYLKELKEMAPLVPMGGGPSFTVRYQTPNNSEKITAPKLPGDALKESNVKK